MKNMSLKQGVIGTLILSALLLIGCRSSYAEVSDGSAWNSLGYQDNASSAVPDQNNNAQSSWVILPNDTTEPSTAAGSETTVTPNVPIEPGSSTASESVSDPIITVIPETTVQSATATEPQTVPVPETTVPETTAPVNPSDSLTVLAFTQTVAKGKKATVTIRGLPNTEYTIKVRYSSGYSSAKGLEPKISDESGVCSWTWTVGGSTKPGSYPITISDGTNSYTLTFTVE